MSYPTPEQDSQDQRELTWERLVERGERWSADRRDVHHDLVTGREIQAEFRVLADKRTCDFIEDRCEWIADPEVNDVWGALLDDDTVIAVYYRRRVDFETSTAFDQAITNQGETK